MPSRIGRFFVAAALVVLAFWAGSVALDRAGASFLEEEAELQLSRWLRGPVSIAHAELVFRGGFGLAAYGVEAYASRDRAAALRARSMVGRLDAFALLTGDFRLSELEVDSAILEVQRRRDGFWTPEALFREDHSARRPLPADPLAAVFTPFELVDKFVHALLRESLAVGLLQVHNSTILFDRRDIPGDPVELSDLSLEIESPRFSERSHLVLRAEIESTAKPKARLEVTGSRSESGTLRVHAKASELPLERVLRLAGARSNRQGSETAAFTDPVLGGPRPGGRVDLDLVYETVEPGIGSGSLALEVRDFEAWIPTDGPRLFESDPDLAPGSGPRLGFEASFAIAKDHFEVTEARLLGLAKDGVVLMAGSGERPLREDSRLRFWVEFRGAGLTQIERVVGWLPPRDAEPVRALISNIEAGRISSLGASGRILVSEWRELLGGERRVLPQPLVLAARFEELAFADLLPGRLKGVSGRAEWSGDHVIFRGIEGRFKTHPTPRLDFGIDGLSLLLETLKSEPSKGPGLAGLGTALERLATRSEASGGSPSATLRLEFDWLAIPGMHPPLRNLALRMEPVPTGTEWTLEAGSIGNLGLHGEALAVDEPEKHWSVSLRFEGAERETKPQPPPAANDEWARGRITVENIDPQDDPVHGFNASFALTGNTLRVDSYELQLRPSGTLKGRARVDLGSAEMLDYSLSGKLEETELESVARFVGLPANFGSGQVEAQFEFEGQLRPGASPWIDASGEASISARDGAIAYDLPLTLSVAQATIGFNPFASRDGARYESLSMSIQLNSGRLSSDDFVLDGALRVVAEGAIEMALAEPSIDATVGVFVQNPVGQILGSIPVLSNLVSNRGLVGGYFEVKGLLEDPAVKSLPAASITEALPQILQWPLRAIGALPAPKAPGNATEPPDEDASALGPLRASPRNRRPGAAGN